MAQHFLLSSKARTLSVRAIYKAGEEKAYETFRAIRWADTNGAPVCPRRAHTKSYEIATRRKFKCAACHHQFSVTSGTIFHSRKMEFVDLLASIALFVNAVKGVSALQMSRDLDCQYKTAFVLCHKLREAMANETAGFTLDGEVEIDGAYFGGHVKPENRKEDRKDRRLKENQSGTRRVVVALRQRLGRTLTFVREYEREGVNLLQEKVAPGSTVYADEATHWDVLEAFFPTERINHSESYSDFNGKHTNWAESFFSRLRRMVQGQHHGVRTEYLHQYAANAAWCEDHRRRDNGANAFGLVGNAILSPVSRSWCGYWQRSTN